MDGNICTNRNTLTSSFPFCVHFIFFSYFTVLSNISGTVLNKNGEDGHPCLSPDFSVMAAIGLSYIPFIMLRFLPFILVSSKFFCHERL